MQPAFTRTPVCQAGTGHGEGGQSQSDHPSVESLGYHGGTLEFSGQRLPGSEIILMFTNQVSLGKAQQGVQGSRGEPPRVERVWKNVFPEPGKLSGPVATSPPHQAPEGPVREEPCGTAHGSEHVCGSACAVWYPFQSFFYACKEKYLPFFGVIFQENGIL